MYAPICLDVLDLDDSFESPLRVRAPRRPELGLNEADIALVDALPDDPFTRPDDHVVRRILARREITEPVLVARLGNGPATSDDHTTGWLPRHLLDIAGEWRSTAAIPAILLHLDTTRAYGSDELIHALTRIGGPATGPLLFALFDRRRTPRARRRAARALASIACAARQFAGHPCWVGNAQGQRREIESALRLLLARHAVEDRTVVQEVAMRLCDLRVTPAWPEIQQLLADGVLRPREGFNERIAADLMAGRLHSLELGAWDISLIDDVPDLPRRGC